jgi:hypothetical protein
VDSGGPDGVAVGGWDEAREDALVEHGGVMPVVERSVLEDCGLEGGG